MVVEYLVTSLAVSFGKKLSNRLLDEVVEVADQQTRKQVKRLFDHPDDERTRQELVAHLEESPVEADKVIASALPYVEPDPTPLGRVRHYIWILNWTLARVGSLHRPAALPGFLNTSGCVSIFDARPIGPNDSPRDVIPDFFEEDDKESTNPICRLFPEESGGVAIRLVPTVDVARETLVSQLNSDYEDIGERLLVNFPEGARTVDEIAWNRIDLVRPKRTMKIGSADIPVKADAPPDERRWCKIRGPEGAIAMRDGLLAQLAAASADYESWTRVRAEFEAAPSRT